MPKISLNCNNCGGTLTKVETRDDMYICTHCGSSHIVKPDEISISNNYNVQQNITKNIYGKEKPEYAELIQKGETYEKLKDYEEAYEHYKQSVKENPANYYAWFCLAKIKLLINIDIKENNKLFQKTFSFDNYNSDFKKAQQLANEKENQFITREFKLLENKYLQLKEYNTEYVNSNNNKERKLTYKVESIILSIIGLLVLVIGIILSATGKSSFVFLIIISVILLGAAALDYSNGKNNNEIINHIKSKNKISLEELMQLLDLDEKDIYERKKLFSKITYLINDGYLCGYKIDKNFIIKYKIED